MIDYFVVSHITKGGTRCRIVVTPDSRKCVATIGVDGLFLKEIKEADPAFHATSEDEWINPSFWSCRAKEIAEAHAPSRNPVETA